MNPWLYIWRNVTVIHPGFFTSP